MEDLLQSQIKNSLRLAMPEGLRDLMTDISREVLRAQPTNLHDFIVYYLEALLLARDVLSIACDICGEVCGCSCQPELDEELRNLGLTGDDLVTAKNLVMEHFDKGEDIFCTVNEGSLIKKLFQKTNIDVNLLEDIQEAVQIAYLKHQQAKLKEKADKASDIVQNAAKRTLQIYEQAKSQQENAKDDAAVKIQASFQGYLVKGAPLDEAALKLKRELALVSQYSVHLKPLPQKVNGKLEHLQPSTSNPVRKHSGRLSSTSLAGSLIHLPKYIPYSVHEEMTFEDFEERETESKNIDYTREPRSKNFKRREKKIIFRDHHVLHKIESCPAEEESDVAEEIGEDIQSESASDNDNENCIIVEKIMCDELEPEIEDSIEVKEQPFPEDILPNLEETIQSDEISIKHDKVSEFDSKVNEQDIYDKSIDDDNIDEEDIK